MTRHLAVAAVLGLSLAATPAIAQQQPTSALRGSNPRGFFLGAHLVGAGITSNEDEADDVTENGGGLGVQLGYGFRNNLAIFADLTGTSMSPESDDDEAENYTLGHFDLGVRYHFASPTRALMPYVEGAFTGRAATQTGVFEDPDTGEDIEAELELRGTAFTFGGGLQYFVSPRFALNGGLRFSIGSFDDVKLTVGDESIELSDLDIDATTTRLNLGFVWYPKAR